jgi:putative ABC transport system permease protein
MLQNYIVVALRNLARNPLYSCISILGLAVGLCAAALAGVTVRNELTYEHFIPGYEHTYLAAAAAVPTGHAPLYNLESPSFVASLLKLNFTQIRAVARIAAADARLRHGQTEAKEKLYWADPNVFGLLPLPAFAGDLGDALRRPDGIVLTRSVAEKYFGHADPLGQSLLLDDAHPMTITAVLEDLPVNGTVLESGIFASALAAYSALSTCDRDAPEIARKGAVMLCGRTYVQLAPQARVDRLQSAIDGLALRSYPKFPGMTMTVHLIRIDRVHLFEGLNPGIQGRIAVVGAVALAILFASCAVFVNLSTARSARRALEVGVRKSCGASRTELILQFVGESVIYAALGASLGLAFANLSLPYVNAFLNSAGHLDFSHDPALAAAIVAATLMVGVLAGSYPAFVLSAFRPSVVLKGSVLRSGGALARQSLVVLQFAILIGLLIAATVIYRQCVYATHDVLRVDSDQILIMRASCKPSLVNELRALPGIRGAYCSSEALLDRMIFGNYRLKDGSPLAIDITTLDFGAFGLYGIKPLAGTLPSEDQDGSGRVQNASHFVINEAAARRLGFTSPAAAIGQPLPLADGAEQLADMMHVSVAAAAANQIVAVVPDFSFDVAVQKIRPTFYMMGAPDWYQVINVKLTGRDIPETLEAIDRISIATGSEKPLERFFLNEYIQNLYLVVLREAQAFGVFAAVAILLACVGLLGLAAATAENRTKEIGIRKAMGAGTTDILRMLLWQFSTPILWANLLAWPLTALLLNRWLESFAYHVDIGISTFLAAGALALTIALATVAGHALLVARAKPVEALRYE